MNQPTYSIPNAAQLLSSVDQLNVWGHLIGISKLGVRFKSPFRADSKPDCKLGLKGDKVRFFDPAKGIGWDILDAYKEKFPDDSWETTVNNIMLWGQGIATNLQIQSGTLYQPRYTLTPIVVEWSDWGKQYWAKRGVGLNRLGNPSTFTQEIVGYELVGENDLGPVMTTQFAKGFVFWANNKPKIYFPEGPKDKKFRGHLQNDDVWLVDRSERRKALGKPENYILLIGKGNKDLLVWSTIVDCDLMNLTAEAVFPTANWLMTNVRMKYKKVIICLDPDPTGVKGANDLLNILTSLSEIGTFEVTVWNWPDKVTKDLDGFRSTHTKQETIAFMKANGFHKLFT